MNLSTERLVANDGEGLDDRPSYVSEAIRERTRLGWQTGLPVVKPPSEYETPKLGGGVAHLYDHYIRGENLLRPDAGGFLATLFEQPEVQSVQAAAEELQTDVSTVEKAAQLHGLEIPGEGEESADQDEADGLTLPSGESVSFGPLHPLVLAQLLSDGLSIEEIAQYLSTETGEHYTPSDIRTACQEHDYLEGGSDDTPNLIPDSKRTVTAGEGEPASTPW